MMNRIKPITGKTEQAPAYISRVAVLGTLAGLKSILHRLRWRTTRLPFSRQSDSERS